MSVYTNYGEFYDIVKYGNKSWKCCFTEKEIAENAHEIWFDCFLYALDKGKDYPYISESLVQLYTNLLEDLQNDNSNIRALGFIEFLDMNIPEIKGIVQKRGLK